MRKGMLGRIVGIAMVSVSAVSLAIATFAWFASAGGELDEKLDGEIGMRGYFYSGDGSPTYPFEIVNPVHFYNLTRLQNLGAFSSDKYFQIGHDFGDGLKCINPNTQSEYDDFLDMSELSQTATILPIGSERTPFVGHFNGNGIPIKNLKVSGYPDDIGVFGYVSYEGYVEGLVCDNLEICSLGYNATTTDDDFKLFDADIDDIFNSSSYIINDTSLSLFKKNGNSFTEIDLKQHNTNTGVSGTTLSNINHPDNRTDDIYKNAYFKANFPSVENDPFTYSWISSSALIQQETVLDIDGDSVADDAIVIDMTLLRNSDDFNAAKETQADVRISLVASTVVNGYTFSRVIQSYVVEFNSNGDVYMGDDSTGIFTAAIFCDYLDTGLVGDRNTNYHHGNNIGFIAGHVNGTLEKCYVYNSSFTFNSNGYVPVLTESDTGLVGEIGVNVVNGINPDIGLVTDGDIGIMNFTKIYSYIRTDMTKTKTIYASKGTNSSGDYKSFVSYSDFLADSSTFNNYKDYLRTYDTGKGYSVYITQTETDMYNYRDTGYNLVNNEIKSDFNAVDFIWNKVIEDEPETDRGMGVFKIVTSYCGGINQQGATYSTYALDSIGDCRIRNGASKTKVYFSTAEYAYGPSEAAKDYSWSTEAPFRPTTLPSYSDVNSFKYPFSRDYNYLFQLDLEQMTDAAGKNYMYNTNSSYLTNYLSSVLIDKYGAPVTPGSSKFGFMFRSSENEFLTTLSSYMPVGAPNGSSKLLHSDGKYYPTNCIAFHIDSEGGANVSVVANNNDVCIYSNNTAASSGGVKPLYAMRSTNVTDSRDSFRYFTYDVEGYDDQHNPVPGKTATSATINSDMASDGNAVYAHIFKLPKGDYVIGNIGTGAKANIFYLAVQGQTDASIGGKDMADLGTSIDKVYFLTEAPTKAAYDAGTLSITDVTFKACYNDLMVREFDVTTENDNGNPCISFVFTDTQGDEFVTYLLSYSPTKQVHFINHHRYKDVNIFYRT